MATVTKGRTFVSGETVTPAKLNELVDNATVTAIQTADISDSAVTTAKIADANVTAAKLATATQQSLVPAGAVMPFAMNSAPSGWLAADGTAVSRTTYAALFSAIGTAHGSGNGSTTFNLPDLRGIFVRGSGSQAISGTTYSGTFAAKEQDAFRSHTHSVTDPGHTHGTDPYATNQPGSQIGYTSPLTSRFGDDTGSSTTGISIQNTGGTETRPANIALLYCIKF